MRVKHVPPAPASLETLAAARQAIPLVPGGEADCCARIMDRLEVPSRDRARVWLTFLRGLGLVEAGPNGFVRTREDVDLSGAFRDGVYGAREVIEVLEAEADPVPADTVLERFPIPEWERRRYQDSEAVWGDRIRNLLDWLVLLGEARRTDAGYIRD